MSLIAVVSSYVIGVYSCIPAVTVLQSDTKD